MTTGTQLSEAEETPLQRVLALLTFTSYSRGYLACCPAHGDRHPSLIVWEDPADDHVGLKCLTGCTRKAIVEAMGLTEADLYVQSKPRALRHVQPGIGMIDLAVDKLIHPHLLDQVGVTDITHKGRQAVKIPYHQPDGSAHPRFRIRTALVAKEGSTWSSGKEPLIPYGLHRLAEARAAGYLVIVEGESDCWTLWQHKFPALGLPGAAMYNMLALEMLSDIKRVYIMQEPDKAGNELPANVFKRLQHVGYTGKFHTLNLAEETGAKDPNDLHKRDFKGFKATFETMLGRARPLLAPGTSDQKRPETMTLTALMKKELPPVKWAISGILPEGLTLLCGKPKMGKSWLVLGFALSIACGGYALGKVRVDQGQVLYLDLEDNERRLQRRAKQVLHDLHLTPDAIHVALSWPRLDKGGIGHLETWLTEHPDTRLVIIDTWTKLAPRLQGQKRTQYEEEYDALTPLKELADQRRISILAVTHLRKMLADDVLDEISGTTGLTGAVDGFLVLKRERGQQAATLHVIGRDIEEEQALALTFNPASATWILEGKADEVQMKQLTKERQAILDLLKTHPQGLSPKDIAEKLGKNFYTTRNTLRKMADEHIVGYGKNTYSFLDAGGERLGSPGSDGERSLVHEKHADMHGIDGIVVSRGIDGIEPSHDSSESSSQEEYDPLDEPVEGNEEISPEAHKERNPRIPRDTIDTTRYHDTIDTTRYHAHHTFASHSPPDQENKEGWEEFYL